MSTARIFQPWRDTPDLSSSMEEFESTAQLHSASHTPSTIHRDDFHSPTRSTFSNRTDDSLQNSWSPSITPQWRKRATGLYKKAPILHPASSRQSSPELLQGDAHDEEEDDEDDEVTAAEIPLPGSPTKGRSVSRSVSPQRQTTSPDIQSGKSRDVTETRSEPPSRPDNPSSNYIRFTVRADVQQRTEPIENAVSWLRNAASLFVRSPLTAGMAFLCIFVAYTCTRALFVCPALGPAPDLIKAAGLARAFEPLMFYSENGHTQVVQLGDTGVAVWDLCESVKYSNMTSGPIIVKELDELSDSLKALALELTRFFANIDGDIDGILLVMEWAQRELAQVSALPESSASVVFANLHRVLSKAGILEDPADGEQTAVGKMVQSLFGSTVPQVRRAALQRTFMEFLSVLEESINNELTASMSLFAHFEAIDRQFHNLQRTVMRETDAQEREESEVLASLWTRIIGGNAGRLRKFERNKQLLLSLRGRTVQNKHVLVDHNGRLLQLRSNLEILRKKLVSPLVRSNVSSTLSIEEQLSGLEGTYTSLRTTREAQKQRLYNLIHAGSTGGGAARTTISKVDDGRRIEESR